MERKYTHPRLRRAFKLYKALSTSQQYARCARPRGQSGIAVDDDEYALRWQSYEFRMHKLDSWIMDDHINWFFARWLSVDEAKERNKW